MSKDKIWKNVISKFFSSFTEFFLPELHENIDFNQKPRFLDNELLKITQKSIGKNRTSDKLVEVSLKDGTNKWILIHIEIQDSKKDDFSFRMFQYFYRIFDKFNKKIVAVAVYTDSNKTFKPNEYKDSFFGTQISYKFNTYKILDQKNNIEELKQSKNPFSLVVLASFYYLESKKDENKRYNFKLELTSLLFEKGYVDQDIKELLDFIDILVKFKTEDLENKYLKEVDVMSKTKDKPLIGNYNKMLIERGKLEGVKEGVEKGVKEGIEKQSTKTAKKMLKNKEPIEKIMEYTGLKKKEIENLIV